jgi:hypothetical protein
MSDDENEPQRPRVRIEGGIDPDGTLASKLAKLQAINSPGLTKVAEAFTAAQEAAVGTSKAAEIVAAMQKSVPTHDSSSFVREMTEANQIRWENMPEARRTRAAEDTAEALKILVDEAIDAKERAAATDRRETVMLRWTIAGVVLAAIAAVASIIAILIG